MTDAKKIAVGAFDAPMSCVDDYPPPPSEPWVDPQAKHIFVPISFVPETGSAGHAANDLAKSMEKLRMTTDGKQINPRAPTTDMKSEGKGANSGLGYNSEQRSPKATFKGRRVGVDIKKHFPPNYVFTPLEIEFLVSIHDECGFCKDSDSGVPHTLIEKCFFHWRCVRCNRFSEYHPVGAPAYLVCKCSGGMHFDKPVKTQTLNIETSGSLKGSRGPCKWWKEGQVCWRHNKGLCLYDHSVGMKSLTGGGKYGLLTSNKTAPKPHDFTTMCNSITDGLANGTVVWEGKGLEQPTSSSLQSTSMPANPNGGMEHKKPLFKKKTLTDTENINLLCDSLDNMSLPRNDFGIYTPMVDDFKFTVPLEPRSAFETPTFEFSPVTSAGTDDVGGEARSCSPNEETDRKYFDDQGHVKELKNLPTHIDNNVLLGLRGLQVPNESKYDKSKYHISLQGAWNNVEHKHALKNSGKSIVQKPSLETPPLSVTLPSVSPPIPLVSQPPVYLEEGRLNNAYFQDYSNLNFQYVSRFQPSVRNVNKIGWLHWILDAFGVDIYVRVKSTFLYAIAAREDDLRSTFASTINLDHKDPLSVAVNYHETLGIDILGYKFFFPFKNFSTDVVASYEAFTQILAGPTFSISMGDSNAFLAAVRSDRSTNNINLNRYASTAYKHWTYILAYQNFNSVRESIDNISLPSVPLNLELTSTATDSLRSPVLASMDRGRMSKYGLRALKTILGCLFAYPLVVKWLVPLGLKLIPSIALISQQAWLAVMAVMYRSPIVPPLRGLAFSLADGFRNISGL
jgi:hypothetical protein